MKGKNILYGTGLYLLSLWALYGKKPINLETPTGRVRRKPQLAPMPRVRDDWG